MPRTSLSSVSTAPNGEPSTSRWSQPSDGSALAASIAASSARPPSSSYEATSISLAASPRRRAGPAEQAGQPARQVAADHVAVLGVGRPAPDQLREDRRAAGKCALQCVFEVQQAQIILAALADNDPPRPLLGVGEQLRSFAV